MNGSRSISFFASRMKRRERYAVAGFTLIEMLMALAAGALILAAVYGVFSKAIHMRDTAMERTRVARLRSHAAFIIRNDLKGAFVSGTTTNAIAFSLQGSQATHNSSFPGYLKFTTTTAKIDPNNLTGDVQEVQYYVATDPDALPTETGAAGMLVRSVNTDLLSTSTTEPPAVTVLPGVKSMDVSFYDGTQWQTTWQLTDTAPTIPQVMRLTVNMSDASQPPLDIFVPWTIQPQVALTGTALTGT